MSLIISFISLFKIIQANILPALTAPYPRLYFSNKFISSEAKLLANPGKLSQAKKIASFVGAFFPKLANHEPKDPPARIILDI